MFDSNFKSVFVMLGSDCNANCKYCLQKGDHKEIKLPEEINDEIIDYIDLMARRYTDYQNTMPESERKYFWVTYFGGEPLLYWDKIVYINEKLLEKGCLFRSSIITNGILLDKEKIDYLNKHNFSVAVSWDGEGSKETRLYNIFEKNKNFMDIENLAINSVLTKYSYPFDLLKSVADINNEYHKIHGKDIGFNLETFIDTGSCNEDKLDSMNEKLLHHEMYCIVMDYLEGKYKDNSTDRIFSRFASQLIDIIRNNIDSNRVVRRGNCLCGWGILNMDLAGNLYRCHNSNTPIGNIHSTINEYYTELAAADTRKKITNCNECDIKHLCNGGCKMVSEDMEDKYCKVQRSYYLGVYDALCEWGEKQ